MAAGPKGFNWHVISLDDRAWPQDYVDFGSMSNWMKANQPLRIPSDPFRYIQRLTN